MRDLIGAIFRSPSDGANNLSWMAFLSYNGFDKVYAKCVADWLEQHMIKTFFAPLSIEIGVEWRNVIRNAIECDSCAFICLWGQQGLSGWQQIELEFTRKPLKDKNGYKIIPTLLPECKRVREMDPYLEQFQRIDLRYDFSPTSNEFKRLIEAVNRSCKG